MIVLNDDEKKVVIAFSKQEYYQIKNWMVGKNVKNIDIPTRDTLDNFISMDSYFNPNPKDCLIDEYPTIRLE